MGINFDPNDVLQDEELLQAQMDDMQRRLLEVQRAKLQADQRRIADQRLQAIADSIPREEQEIVRFEGLCTVALAELDTFLEERFRTVPRGNYRLSTLEVNRRIDASMQKYLSLKDSILQKRDAVEKAKIAYANMLAVQPRLNSLTASDNLSD